MKRLLTIAAVLVSLAVPALAQRQQAPPGPLKVTAIKAGRLIDTDTGAVSTNQIILIEGEKIKDVWPNVAIPPGTEVIDLSKMTVMPGLVDAHAHLAMTYKEFPENNLYYYTYVQDA